MIIERLLTPNIWLQALPVVRNHLAKAFKTERSASPRIVTELGNTRVESDGFTVEDLRVFSVESMQEWLGFTTIDPMTDVNALFEMCATKAEETLGICETIISPSIDDGVAPVEKDTTPENVDSVEKTTTLTDEPFCHFCTAKGPINHLKVCNRPSKTNQ